MRLDFSNIYIILIFLGVVNCTVPLKLYRLNCCFFVNIEIEMTVKEVHITSLDLRSLCEDVVNITIPLNPLKLYCCFYVNITVEMTAKEAHKTFIDLKSLCVDVVDITKPL